MWIIAKYNINEFNTLKKSLKEKLGTDPDYYMPKIKYSKVIKKKFISIKKLILEGYLICFHPNFKKKIIINTLNYTKGIKYVLNGFENNQAEIINFVDKCKSFEDKEGFLQQDFFSNKNFVKAKFISGPFTNLVFDIISKDKCKIEILIGKYKTTLDKKSSFLYKPI